MNNTIINDLTLTIVLFTIILLGFNTSVMIKNNEYKSNSTKEKEKTVVIKLKNEKIIIVEGGNTRIESLIKSSSYIYDNADVIMVHDGARPFVSEKLIKLIERETKKYGAVIPVIDLKDTIKEVKNSTVIKTLNRDLLKAVQTPQSYKYKIFKKMISKLKDMNLTDDSQAIEKITLVHIVKGEETNIKITTPLDLKIAEVIYEEREKINY